MTAFLVEFLVRTALIAGAVAIVLRLFCIHAASARHAAWTAVVAAMLLLPIALAGGLKVPVPVLEPTPAPADMPNFNVSVPETTLPFDAASAPSSPVIDSEVAVQAAATFDLSRLLWSLYAAGVLVLLVRLAIGTLAANRLRRSAVVSDGQLTSDRCATPITVGWFRPALILPAGWDQWPAAKLEAVVTHEHEHARRHDPLIQWIALFNRAVFWFHPLAWWLERRLATLAEEACDAAVIAAGHSPQDYSEYLVDMARAVTREHGRVHVVGMAMPGTGLSERVRLILQGLPTGRLSRTRLILSAVFCATTSVVLAAGTLAERAATWPLASQQAGALTSANPLNFDVVAIRPCPGLRPPGAGRGVNPRVAQVSPGYVTWDCVSLEELVDAAYAGPDSALLNTLPRPRGRMTERPGDPKRVRGGPSWVYSDRFAIEARAADVPDRTVFTGPMLRALLDDRFRLKVHRATEERPMYALSVARTGLKLTATAPADCWVRPEGMSPRTPQPAGLEGKPTCGTVRVEPVVRTGTTRREYVGVELRHFLSGVMDRFVLDRTGVAGRFSFVLEYREDEHTPDPLGADPVDTASRSNGGGPSIFQALEALGLRLEPTKGPAEYLVIDNVQRPAPDRPASAPATPEITGPSVPQTGVGTRLQQAAGSAPVQPDMQIKFEAVSIRPCVDSGPSTGRGSGSIRRALSPGYASWGCVSLAQLVDHAWGSGLLADNWLQNTIHVPPGVRPDVPKRVRGGPAWVEDERFAIEIRMSGDTTGATGSARHDQVVNAMAPALRAMLEDRFQLKLQKMTEERPMYALVVAKSGLTIAPTAPSRCWPRSRNVPPAEATPPPGFAGVLSCDFGMSGGGLRGNRSWEFTNINLKDLAGELAKLMDRYVLDKTGVDGRFSFKVEYAPDDSTPGDLQRAETSRAAWRSLLPKREQSDPVKGDGPTIFRALEALGLRLEPTRGPAEYLRIESAQRPKLN